MNIFYACQVGDLTWLKQQKAAKKLGRLMIKKLPVATPQFPHEYAAAGGHLDVLKWLVMESGSSVDLTRNHNQTVLLAIEHEHLDVIKWLVESSGQKINLAYGLYAAVVNENFRIMSEIFEKMDVSALGDQSLLWQIFMEVVGHGKQDLVELMVRKLPVELFRNMDQAFVLAAFAGHISIAEWLVHGSGFKIDITVDDHQALKDAVKKEHVEFVEWLKGEYIRRNLKEELCLFETFGTGDLAEAMKICTKEELAASLDGVKRPWRLSAVAPVYRQAENSGLVILFAEDNKSFMRVFMHGALTRWSERMPSIETTVRVSDAGFLRSWKSMVDEYGFQDFDGSTEEIYAEYFIQKRSTSELTIYADAAGIIRLEIVAPQAVFAVRSGRKTVSYGLVIRKADLNRPVPRTRSI